MDQVLSKAADQPCGAVEVNDSAVCFVFLEVERLSAQHRLRLDVRTRAGAVVILARLSSQSERGHVERMDMERFIVQANSKTLPEF